MFDSNALASLAVMAMVGIAATVILFFTVPPALMICLMWLIEPQTGIEWQTAAWWIGGGWVCFWVVMAVIAVLTEKHWSAW